MLSLVGEAVDSCSSDFCLCLWPPGAAARRGLLQGVLAEVGLVTGTVCRLAVLPLAHITRVSSWKPGAQVTSGQNEVKKTLDDLY